MPLSGILCCFGRKTTHQSIARETISNDCAIYNQKLTNLYPTKPWHSPNPLTRTQLIKDRLAFWETAAVYGGHAEIWNCLKQVCECNDESLARSLINSLSLTLPKGNLTEIYDSKGYNYCIPMYCLKEPENLIEGVSEDDLKASEYSGHVDVHLRFANFFNDLIINSIDRSSALASLIPQIREHSGGHYEQVLFFCQGQGPISHDHAVGKHLSDSNTSILQVLLR